MHELTKTALFCLVAAVLAVAAVVVDPGAATPEVFSDEGEPFYPDLTDPQAPRAIEVIDYDEVTATAQPLKIEFRDNRWGIPSHHDYPADAEDRLPKTAAALMELRKDIIVSDRVENHQEYGVVDPFDQTVTSLAGRGKRVTLRDDTETALADFIVGDPVDGKPGYRYLRVPDQRRTYAVKTEADVSSRFVDWIETDLLKLSTDDIRAVAINSYSINERLGRLDNVERMTLTRTDARWAISGSGQPDEDRVKGLTQALADLRIVDVEPKPANLTRDLKTEEGIRLTTDAIVSLRQKGFFVTPQGQLLSNEGEIVVDTANGLQYTLRFGEIASGGAADAPDGADTEAPDAPADGAEPAAGDAAEAADAAGERRYLFITVAHSADRARQYAEGVNPAGAGEDTPSVGETLATELRERFADWYYVITGADFNTLRPRRRDLIGG